MTAVFPPGNTEGADRSSDWLTLGVLHESILALGDVTELLDFWPSVCERARWVVPCRRVAAVEVTGERARVLAMLEDGDPADPVDIELGSDELSRALLAAEPVSLDAIDPHDAFSAWLAAGAEGGIVVVPIHTDPDRAALVYALPRIDDADRRFVWSAAALFGQHVAMAHRALRASAELTEQRDRVRSLIDLTSDAIVVVDGDGIIVQTTERVREMFGYEPSELVGRPVELLVPAGRRDAHARHRAAFASDPQRRPMGAELELFARRADGETFPVEISLAPLPSEQDGLVLAAVRDVTDHRRAIGLTSLLQSIAVESNATVDPDDIYAAAIEAVCRFTGWPLGHAYVVEADGALVPTGIWHVEQPTFDGFRDLTMRTIFERGVGMPGEVLETGKAASVRDVRLDPRFVRVVKDGSTVAGAFAFPVVVGPEVVAVLEFFSSEPGEPDGDLLEAMAQVGVQVGRVVERSRARDELRRRALELERSNTDLERFAYVASHDLQEPLRMVTGYLQLLERRYGDALGEDATEFIAFAVDGARRMQELIQALLEYSRVGRAELEPEPIDTAVLLEDVLRDLGSAIAEAGAEVVGDALPIVSADASQLRQLFQNLIANAIKFHGDQPPLVRVAARRQGSETIFTVSDNGIGVPPEFQGRIFTVFQRLHTRSEYQGTGIGLAVCQKIVERHGGRIWVESDEGFGSHFHFSLPGVPR